MGLVLLCTSGASAAPEVDGARSAAVAPNGESDPGVRPALIAERNEISWFAPAPYTFHVVREGKAHQVDQIEALTLADESDAAWRTILGESAALLVTIPLATGLSLLASGGVMLAAIAALPELTPGMKIDADVRWAMAGAGLGVAVLSLAGAALGGWATRAMTRAIVPSEAELGGLDDVEYVDKGGVPALLAERACLEDTE